jgi:hypothetical protein
LLGASVDVFLKHGVAQYFVIIIVNGCPEVLCDPERKGHEQPGFGRPRNRDKPVVGFSAAVRREYVLQILCGLVVIDLVVLVDPFLGVGNFRIALQFVPVGQIVGGEVWIVDGVPHIELAVDPVRRPVGRPGPDRKGLVISRQHDEFVMGNLGILPRRGNAFQVRIGDGGDIQFPREEVTPAASAIL